MLHDSVGSSWHMGSNTERFYESSRRVHFCCDSSSVYCVNHGCGSKLHAGWCRATDATSLVGQRTHANESIAGVGDDFTSTAQTERNVEKCNKDNPSDHVDAQGTTPVTRPVFDVAMFIDFLDCSRRILRIRCRLPA